jgi:glycosyltransferase involved in cell wall biosynthesis
MGPLKHQTQTDSDAMAHSGASLDFDGIICIGGEDWWYHNRGHFDFQIMRRLAARWPVLFVNSLGVRMPGIGEGRKFLSRIGRKLRSLGNGLVNVENRFWVCSPVAVPGGAGLKLSGWALGPQIRMAAAVAGIRRPLLWVHCPAGAALLDQIPAVATVLQRTDRFEAFPEASGALVASQIAVLKRRADLAVYCAPHLMAEETAEVRRQLLVTHGADVQAFSAAGRARGAGPADVALLPRPRVGFVGGIDAHTFDPELFLGVAGRLRDCAFVMVGGCSLPEGWCGLPNVHLLGRKPYELVARYMAACDVLIMPWNDSDWIRACNPIKLKEYLATGRPVVTTDFPALDGWRDVVTVTAGADAFAEAVRSALATDVDRARLAVRLAGETWDAKAGLVAGAIADLGLRYAAPVPARAA